LSAISPCQTCDAGTANRGSRSTAIPNVSDRAHGVFSVWKTARACRVAPTGVQRSSMPRQAEIASDAEARNRAKEKSPPDMSQPSLIYPPNFWSGQQDLNLRPAVPKTAALPGCAIPRPGTALDTCFPRLQQAKAGFVQAAYIWPHLPKIDPVTRSPGATPSLRAVPAITSSTARTGPPDGMSLSDIGCAFSATRRIRPSLRMKMISSEM
jgi:hypothetical protein